MKTLNFICQIYTEIESSIWPKCQRRKKINRENLSKAMANIIAKENIYDNCKVNQNIILNEDISESKGPIVINCNCNNNNDFFLLAYLEI